MRILHIAPFNTANVPLAFVRAERKMGHDSRLITLHRHRFGYDEDICLNLPLIDSVPVNILRSLRRTRTPQTVFEMIPGGREVPRRWKPAGLLEKLFHVCRDRLWESAVEKAWREFKIDTFDLYQLDGGLGFLRSGKFIRRLRDSGKKIICCYLGSDLRTRGIIPAIDEISLHNFTVEFDLQAWYPGITYVPFPFDAAEFQESNPVAPPPFVIGHAPSNRAAKGSDLIIAAVQKLKKRFPISLRLIEGKPYSEAIALKQDCHIFIDQLGPLGYGINSLEALAMGIPVCSSLAPGFKGRFPDVPIHEITPENLEDVLASIMNGHDLIKDAERRGREWVMRFHDAKETVRRIHDTVFG